MRKLTLLFAAALSFQYAANAQKGIELGVEFTPMTTWILNNEDFDEGAELNFRGTFGFLTGLSAGYNITDGFGIQTGFMYNKCGQNYITDYDNVAKADQNTFKRSLSYFRVPVLFKVNGSGETGGMYFRVGPHFDFLNSARYVYDIKATDAETDLDWNMKQPSKSVDVDLVNGPFFPNPFDDSYKFYKGFVVGATLEMGGSVNINENMKIIFMLHLEGSLTNPEDEDAGLVYPSTALDERGTAWQVGGGLNVGFHYVIPVGN